MREQSKPLAYGALSTALAVVTLYLGSLLPTARLALLCVSSLAVVLMCLRFDWRRALAVYGAVSVLSLLILPGKDMAMAFALLPGWYPIAKLRLERLSSPPVRFAAKLLLAAAVLLPAMLLPTAINRARKSAKTMLPLLIMKQHGEFDYQWEEG